MKQGFDEKGWGGGILLALGVFTFLSASGAFAARTENKAEALSITVRIQDSARIDGEILSQAEGVAANLFKVVGVHLAWLHCGARLGVPAANRDCSGASPRVLIVRILPQLAPEGRGFLSEDALGFAVAPPHPDHGYLASVYWDRIRQQAAQMYHHEWQVLGFAIAHEIGHLLLGSNSHSRFGLMRGKWDRESMKNGANSLLFFSADQVKVIRADVRDRIELAETAARLRAPE